MPNCPTAGLVESRASMCQINDFATINGSLSLSLSFSFSPPLSLSLCAANFAAGYRDISKLQVFIVNTSQLLSFCLCQILESYYLLDTSLAASTKLLNFHLEAVPHACGSVGFHFFADLVVDKKGREARQDLCVAHLALVTSDQGRDRVRTPKISEKS